MVINDLNMSGVAFLPLETNAVLIVYSNAELPASAASQRFKTVSR